METYIEIPLPVIKRLPHYQRLLQIWRQRGDEWASSSDLARELGFSAIQVRKDLAWTGVKGTPKRGFLIQELITSLGQYLGQENLRDVFLIGTSPLGLALLDDPTLAIHGFSVVAVFSEKPQIQENGRYKVFPLEKIPDLSKRLGVRLAILAAPIEHAQSWAEKVFDWGIDGIWNISGARIEAGYRGIVINEDPGARLTSLAGEIVRKTKDRVSLV